MAEYPLSAKSSKKFGRARSPLGSGLGSSCRSQEMAGLREADYRGILAGERIFIELYCQGKVVATDYNQWVRFMGGTLHKRLNDRVTIFLTNSDAHDLTAVLERVRRSTTACRVVSILWFEQCFLEKAKVSFDGFALDGEREEVETEESQHRFEDHLVKFVADVGEDVEMEMREFFRREEKPQIFQYLAKGQANPAENWFGCREIDLGPHPNRKVRGKGDRNRKRRKSSMHSGETNNIVASPRQSKSLNGEEPNSTEKKTSNSEKKDCSDKAKPPPEQKASRKRNTLQNLMSKYLKQESLAEVEEKQVQRTISIDAKSMAEITNMIIKEEQSKKASSERPISLKDQLVTSSKGSAGGGKRFNIGFRYKDANTQDYNLQTIRPNADLTALQTQLSSHNQSKHTMFVVSAYGRQMESKIAKINQLAVNPNSIHVQPIDYELYSRYLASQPPLSTVYFLIDPMRLIERPYFYALHTLSPQHPTLVNAKLLDQIRAFNEHVQNLKGSTVFKFEAGQLRYTRALKLVVRGYEIEGKKVAMLNSELPVELQKRVIGSLGGLFVSKEQYLLDEDIEIIVGNRWGIKDSSKMVYCECDLWKTLFRLEGLDQL